MMCEKHAPIKLWSLRQNSNQKLSPEEPALSLPKGTAESCQDCVP